MKREAPTESATRARVIAAVAEVLEIDPSSVQGSSRMREDLGMDSLASLELMSHLSEQLDVDLELEQAMGIETVDDTCAFIARALMERPARKRASAHG